VNVLPVIARELRASSRHPFTYNLRALAVGALVLASFFFGMQHGFEPNIGGRLFAHLHFTLFCAIWILVPMLTADCISRERREGTLGLLFLTRLNGADIVVAKGLAHGLRALTLWVAALPVVAIPFMLGGLSWAEAFLSVLINLSAMCWALAAGLLASAWSNSWSQSVLRAMALALLFVVGLWTAIGWVAASALSGPTGAWLYWKPGWHTITPALGFVFVTGVGFVTNATTRWSNYLRLGPSGQLVSGLGAMAALSLLGLFLSLLAAGAKTRRVLQEQPPSARRIWWQQKFCTPVLWTSFFRRWMRRKLELNPIGWLEQRTWQGRLVTWGWFAVIVSIYSVALMDQNSLQESSGLEIGTAWLLTGSMALSAAGSFRRERESGVLELLLVSPLSEADVVWGRLRGLWSQFLPAFGTLWLIWIYFSSLFSYRADGGQISFFVITFFTLPLIGLYFSLSCRNFMTAFLCTLGYGIFVPMLVPGLLWFANFAYSAGSYIGPVDHAGPLPTAVQVIIAMLCWQRLITRLRQRNFPLARSETR
jgi:ABC-type transport system involved in multi-copper enzyme maturation permease subunit